MLPCVCSVIDHMTSKCGKNKKGAHHEAIRWCSYPILTSSLIYYWTDARHHGIYLFYKIKKQATGQKKLFYFKIFQYNSKAALCPPTRKKPFDVIYCLYKMKHSHWLLCVAKELWLVKEITPQSNLNRALLLTSVCFSYLFNASIRLFYTSSFASHVKYYSTDYRKTK